MCCVCVVSEKVVLNTTLTTPARPKQHRLCPAAHTSGWLVPAVRRQRAERARVAARPSAAHHPAGALLLPYPTLAQLPLFRSRAPRAPNLTRLSRLCGACIVGRRCGCG